MRGVVTEIDIAFFRQLMQVYCADMHFMQKFLHNNHSFSFYGLFFTRFLAHNFLLQEKLPDVSLGYCDVTIGIKHNKIVCACSCTCFALFVCVACACTV